MRGQSPAAHACCPVCQLAESVKALLPCLYGFWPNLTSGLVSWLAPEASTVSPRKAAVGTGEDLLDHMETSLPIPTPHSRASLRPISTPGSFTSYIPNQPPIARDPVLTKKEPERWRSWRARDREPITGVWGRSPQWGPGAKPLVRGSGGRS